MTFHRGMGHLRDVPSLVAADDAHRHVGALVRAAAAAGPPPEAVSWRHLLDLILDQGQSSSCVGCGMATQVLLRTAYLGRPVRPSEKGIYDVARLVDRPGGPVFDLGCRPGAAMLGMHEHGLAARARWPLTSPSDEEARAMAPDGTAASWIDALPPFDVFSAGADAQVTGHFRADTGDIVGMLKRALAIGQFPGYAQYVRPDYQDVRGDEIYEVSGPPNRDSDPSHYQTLCGYDQASAHVVSSWGRGHGDGGIVRVSWSVIASSWSFDRLVVTSAPTTIR